MDASTHEHELTAYAMERLAEVKGLHIFGPDADKRGGVVGLHAGRRPPARHRADSGRQGVAIRAGHHCASRCTSALVSPPARRASFYLYNTMAEVDLLVKACRKWWRYSLSDPVLTTNGEDTTAKQDFACEPLRVTSK